MDNLIFCLNATVPIFVLIILGKLLQRWHFFSPATMKDMDNLVFKLLLPISLFRSISSNSIAEQFDLRFFLFCFCATLLSFFVIWAGASLLLPEKAMVGAFTQGAFRGSQAILGMAFMMNLYSNAGLVPLMILASVPLFNIFSVVALTLSAAGPSQKKGLAGRTLHGVVTNPIILGILIALPFSFLQVEFPAMVAKTLDALANCATPLALLSIGASFEGAKAFKKIVPTSAASFIKLVGLPIVFLPVAVWMGFRGQALVTILIMLGTPAPPAGYVMAKKLHGDAELASSIVVVTTAFSAVTLTVLLYIVRVLGLV